MSAEPWAQRVHSDGFVVLSDETFKVSESTVDLVRTQVLHLYEAFLTEASTQRLDLTRREHAERLPGFYVREGGRIDMQLSTVAFQTRPRKGAHGSRASVDMNVLQEMATRWQSVVTAIFAPHAYQLEYIGCVVSRPGDGDQNWHLDGVHRNNQRQEPVDRLNVFVPLTTITKQTGGTEMKLTSHVHDHGARGTAFEGYKDLPSVTACIEAGTPLIMDYRVWHRGVANTSVNVVRPLLYFKYAKRPVRILANAPASSEKKRKRITPVVV
ncbi:hypothetical protein PsorP6_018150 [Peronosclerospora sorghi]|uniref:Uncharacterized protein n=1 Tax=Peronosclerospora sorghi TaxID=230839 RepID=A0ACC0WFG9_9STRA|nr:hypothetical protein PsorP6_018150 [Peronosclerospora sorghi]